MSSIVQDQIALIGLIIQTQYELNSCNLKVDYLKIEINSNPKVRMLWQCIEKSL